MTHFQNRLCIVGAASLLLVLGTSYTLAQNLPAKAAAFPETVHVTASEVLSNGTGRPDTQRLEVLVAGKKYVLSGPAIRIAKHLVFNSEGVLSPGDYKAKAITNPDRKPDYLLCQGYELLLPDGKTTTLVVTGQSE